MLYIRKALVFFFAILIWPITSTAVIVCKAPDDSFKGFFLRFTEDAAFQQSRIIFPLVHRFGDYTMTNPIIELWDINRVKTLTYPLILSQTQRKAKGIEQSDLLTTSRYAEVLQDRPEADDYRLLYKFRNVDRCWFLEEIHDRSL
jgi:hypothetical protein